MNIVKLILAVFLIATGLAAALLLMATGLIHDGSEDYPLWKVMNWFMAVGVVVVLVVSCARKRSMGGGGDDVAGMREYVAVNAAFYGAIVLTMLFFWEWFWTLNPESETGDAVTSHLVYFPIMDALFTCLAITTAANLWYSARARD